MQTSSVNMNVNAMFVFMMFGKLHISNMWINSIATSMFAVYIIHCQPIIHNIFVMGVMRNVLNFSQGGIRKTNSTNDRYYAHLCAN